MPAGKTRSLHSLDDVIRACDNCYRTYGFVNYAQVGRALGLTRQAIQLRIKTAHQRGQISDATLERFRQSSSAPTVTMEIQVSPETRDYLRDLAERLGLRISTIVEGAITKYRHTLRE